VVIPLLALSVVLVALVWFIVIYYHRFKKRISKESSEVTAVLSHEFDAIINLLQQKKLAVAESRKTKKLTKLEEQTFAEIEQAFYDAKVRINKEVVDVDQLVNKQNQNLSE